MHSDKIHFNGTVLVAPREHATCAAAPGCLAFSVFGEITSGRVPHSVTTHLSFAGRLRFDPPSLPSSNTAIVPTSCQRTREAVAAPEKPGPGITRDSAHSAV